MGNQRKEERQRERNGQSKERRKTERKKWTIKGRKRERVRECRPASPLTNGLQSKL